MSRAWRIEFDGAFYHVMSRGNEQREIFTDDEDHLSFLKVIGEAHRRYTRHMNFAKGWRGYLWQGRFSSYPMDETYLLLAAR